MVWLGLRVCQKLAYRAWLSPRVDPSVHHQHRFGDINNMAHFIDRKPRKEYTLFGGATPWSSDDWTASDDRVRGGKSQSYLECSDTVGRFHGNLDIETLGGAGFASQRTTDDREWDLSDYAGLQILVSKGDKKRYTLNLKDELLPRDPDTGREQSTVSYECDFEIPPQDEPGHATDRKIFIPWTSFNATYRGRLKKDAKPINLKKVKRLSIMMRSFFGSQSGDFSLTMRSIVALSEIPNLEYPVVDGNMLEKGSITASEDPYQREVKEHRSSIHTSADRRRRIACLLLGAISLAAMYYFTGLSCR
ncbi:uncharacterized protein CLAFUR5_00677 [Fulvia fulva]|uniref:NADH:ubiquinone oxidoreductase intermediate-associated protein 30 domain-containing protein n=1 Tax=Passalora fulva TaxID=5499 RepID=A0A9Q8L4X9_PASFU|nr:uncharacterized protein CLAFUR5_00677 [Fulvia fulva]KAK4637882.1 hypothetical protein CLAFUR0_00676 [Fulvia fulva]UJO10940.1 hypothetical protein CLAFUR5_00677 [Fulvia fulva]